MEKGDNMNDEKEIITFEELYKSEKRPRNEKYSRNNQDPTYKKSYWYTILYYALVMYVVASIMVLVMYGMPQFTITMNEDERIVDAVASTTDGLTIIQESIWDNYSDTYGDYVEAVGQYNENYIVLVNKNNIHYPEVLCTRAPITQALLLDSSKLEAVISSSPTVTEWAEGASIQIFVSSTLSQITYPIAAPSEMIQGSMTFLSADASSILNFLIYLFLLPGIYYFMRLDLKIDFIEAKNKKKGIILPIIIGYAYVWVGNLVANFFSTYISQAMDVQMGEAANQQAVISAVTSSTGILMIVSAVIIGPIIEELVFRKAVFGLISNNTVALIVSTLVFGFIHVMSEASVTEAIINGSSYFVMGFVFSFIYLKSDRNIMIPIAVHILNNAISILLIFVLL